MKIVVGSDHGGYDLKEALRRRLEESTAFVRQSLAGYPGLDSLRFVTGVAVRPARSADFSVMLDQAAHVCGQWWNAAADMVAFLEAATLSHFTS